MDRPLVSVIIPLHNAAPWIGECVESVLHQSYSDIEVIIVENGSTDNSLEIAQSYVSERVHVLVSAIPNVSAARNLGTRHAQGVNIQYIDADDKLAGDKIERQITVLERYHFDPSVVAMGNLYVFDGSKSYVSKDIKERYLPAIEILIDLFLTKSSLNCACYLVHKKLIDLCDPWDENLVRHEDWLWLSTVLSKAESAVFIRDSISYYRTDNIHSLSKQYSDHAIESEISARMKIVRMLDKCNSPQKHKVEEMLIMSWNRVLYPYYRKKRKVAEFFLKQLYPDCKIEYPNLTWKERFYYLAVFFNLVKSQKKP